MQRDPFVRVGMDKTDLRTVQRLTLDELHAASVEIVARQRMSQAAHMTADLMRSAGLQNYAAQGVSVSRRNRLIMRHGIRAVGTDTTPHLAV